MNKVLSTILKITLAPLVGFLFIKEVKGRDNFPDRNVILASNHQSYLDILLCGYVCVPRKYTHIGQVDRENKGWSGIRDLLYSLAEVIPVNRKDENSKKQAFLKAVKFLKNGYSLVIYPEGTRTRTGEVGKGKWGVAKFFLETGVPILPMGIKGAFELFPPGEKPKVKRNIRLNIGKPLFFKEEFELAEEMNRDSKEYEDICIKITEKVMEEIKKLTYED
ncbi:MAG TPA: lysophospholipid acyltransferase family protein [Candidatus Pacearchaeota archaeon]|nr:lysophospholipid acyltransferase family protein [Candidatus Pacearchaeota archaeon]HPR79843.1 lysophospholipid acyltransferase family protein [Candidatus Pacearchaeota archaeon]